MTLSTQIENSKAYNKLEKFKQAILMKRVNRLQVEDAIVNARNVGIDFWKANNALPPHWQAIVIEIITNETISHG